MTSRQRLLAAARHEPTDRVPVCFRGVRPLEVQWSNRLERAAGLLALGVDDKIPLEVPWLLHPDVRVSQRWVHEPGASYPLVVKEYTTPAGVLRQTVRQTGDFVPDDLPLRSDHAWSRSVEYPIKTEADLEKLSYLLHDPTTADLKRFREYAAGIRSFADYHGVLVEGVIVHYAGLLGNLLGPERMLELALDDPSFLQRLLAMIHAWSMKQLELLLDLGVNSVYTSGAYETTDLWSPQMVRSWFLPRRRELVQAAHQAGALFHYFTQTGIMPLLDDYREMEIDFLSALDTQPGSNSSGAVDLAYVKRRIGDAVCLWGGVSADHVVELGTQKDVREAVEEAVAICAPGRGYVLSLSGSVYRADDAARRNVTAFIEAARAVGVA